MPVGALNDTQGSRALSESLLRASEASPHPQHLAKIVSYLRAKRAPIPSTWPDRHERVVVEPRLINEEMLLDPDLGGTEDLKSDLRDL